MNITYHKWLDIEVMNSYFPDAVCKDLSIIPLAETSRRLDNYNILLHKKENVFSFFAGISEASEFSVIDDFKDLEELHFQVLVSADLFFNYTNLTKPAENELYYFSNDYSSEENNKIHAETFVSELDIIRSRAKIFTFELAAESKSLQIKNNKDEIILNEDLSNNTLTFYPINLSSYNDGLYELYIDNKLNEKIFISDSAFANNCMGVLSINIDSLKINFSEALKYMINFNVRSVFWQYKIVVPGTRKIEVLSMEIKGGSQETYDGPIEEPIVGGQIAKIFTSNTLLALQYKLENNPQLVLSYSSEFSNKKDELEINLPNADVENLGKFNTGEHADAFFSSTIIYV